MTLEHRRQPLLPRRAFLRRFAGYLAMATVLIGGSLGIGMIGYHQLEGLSWLDSFLNAAMILGGMGPVNPLHTGAGKLFAGVYALFAGLLFLAVAGILFTPLVHRLFHRFHLETGDAGSTPPPRDRRRL
jgi:hypothetical protein